jgi:HK97 family phage major capsid protein
VKAVAPVTLAGNVTLANPAPVLSTIVDAEVYKINRNQGANILDYVNLGTTDLATIVYVEEIGGEGDAGVTPEGEIKNATDVDFREVASSAIKVPATVKISEEMLSDAPNLAQAVEEITSDKVYRKVASRVVQAAIDKATEYDLTDYNGAVQDANMADAIHAALVQSEKSGFVPNALIINPVDFGSLRFIKSADGTPNVSYYGEGRFPVFSESLAIIKRTDMPAGSFVVGDLNAIKVRYYRRSVELGLSGDDFVRNLRTLRAEDRVHIYSPSTEAKSLVKGVFSTIVSALDAE